MPLLQIFSFTRFSSSKLETTKKILFIICLSIEVNKKKNEINYQSSITGARILNFSSIFENIFYFLLKKRASEKAARQGIQSLFLK